MAVFASFCIPFPPSTLMWQMTTVAKDGFVQKELCQTLPLASWHYCIHRLSTRLNGRENALLVGREEALAERNILCFPVLSILWGERTSKYLKEQQQPLQHPLIMWPLQRDSGAHPKHSGESSLVCDLFAECSMMGWEEPARLGYKCDLSSPWLIWVTSVFYSQQNYLCFVP